MVSRFEDIFVLPPFGSVPKAAKGEENSRKCPGWSLPITIRFAKQLKKLGHDATYRHTYKSSWNVASIQPPEASSEKTWKNRSFKLQTKNMSELPKKGQVIIVFEVIIPSANIIKAPGKPPKDSPKTSPPPTDSTNPWGFDCKPLLRPRPASQLWFMIPKGLCKNKITMDFPRGNQKIQQNAFFDFNISQSKCLVNHNWAKASDLQKWSWRLLAGLAEGHHLREQKSRLFWTFWETPTELSNRWALRLHLLALEKMSKKLRPVVSETLQKWKNWKSYMQKIYNNRGTFRFHTEMVTRNGTTPANMFSFSNACSL